MTDYSRERTHTRLIEGEKSLGAKAAVRMLMQAEASVESDRQKADGTYSVARHVELLIAIMSEARLLVRRVPDADAV